jgi:nitrate/nitrite transporter NarK
MLPYATSAVSATLIICVLMFFVSFTAASGSTNFLDLTPSYSGVLMGLANTVGQFAGFVGIASTGWIVAATGNYTSAFLLAAAVNVIGAVFWIAFCSAKPITD